MINFIKRHRLYLTFTLVVGLFWSWLWFVNASRITSDNLVSYTTIGFCYFTVVLISAAIFTAIYRYLRRKYKTDKPVNWLLRVIVVWAFAEAFVAWFVTIIFMGRNGSIDSTLPFGSLTPFIMYTPLRFLSRYVGFYGLSAVVVAGVAGIILKKTRKVMLAYWVIIVALTFSAWAFYRHTNLPSTQATIVAETLEQKETVNSHGSKLVVFPEYGLDDQFNSDAPPRYDPASPEFYYVGSKQSQVANGHTNNLIFGNSKSGPLKIQAKNRLIPNGEYLPYGIDTATYYVSNKTYADFQVQRAVIKGDKPIQPFRIDKQLIVGAEVCSSIMSTRDYRMLVKKGSTVLTNSASLEIFEGSRLYSWQDQGMATFMAVANARPFLQSTNNWPAIALDHNGNLLAKIYPNNQQQVTIQPNALKTPYTMLGEWLAVIGGLVYTAELIHQYKHRKKPTKKST